MAVYSTHKYNQPWRYLYLLQPDGIGTQFIYISKLLDYAIKNNCKLMVDFRQMAFFIGWGLCFDKLELDNVFRFDTDLIIYDPTEIDDILKKYPNEIIGTRFSHEKSNTTDLPILFVNANELLATTEDDATSCTLAGKLKLVGDFQQTFQEYKHTMQACVGVHARLGNGEQHVASNGQRMKISRDRFFEQMDEHADKSFFICTDTPSFLETSVKKYGNRIIALDRFRPPENCGPGHNTWSIYDDKIRKKYMAERNSVGPCRLLGDALVEMYLLGECKKLICNNSSFTHYARSCCGVDSMILE